MQIQRVDELGVLGLVVNKKANQVNIIVCNTYFSQSGHYPVKLNEEILAMLNKDKNKPDNNSFLIAEFPNVRLDLARVYMSEFYDQLRKLADGYDLYDSKTIKKLKQVMSKVISKAGPAGHGNHLFRVRL